MYFLGFHILFYILWGATLAVTAFALAKGDSAVRYAALTHVAVAIATFIVNPQMGDVAAESLLLAVDFGSAVIFLLLAVRFANLWIGATMLLQSAQFSIHAYYIVMELPHDKVHAWLNNTCDWGILSCIGLGAALAVRRRVVLAREEAALELMRRQRSSVAA